MDSDHDSRAAPLPAIALRQRDYAGIRVWPASRPIYDNTSTPDHGTKGFHVHAYSKTEFIEKGGHQERRKVVDDTFESVTIDGMTPADLHHIQKECRDDVCNHVKVPHPPPDGLWVICQACDMECSPTGGIQSTCTCCGGSG